MTKYLAIMIATFGFAATPSLLAQGCCEGNAAMKGCTMGQTSLTASEDPTSRIGATDSKLGKKTVFMQPVQSVFDGYISIQTALAQDSIEGVAKTATAMAGAIRGDSMQMLSPTIAEQAEALAQAKNLETARTAYKSLSESLINFVKSQNLPAGTYFEVYCPMAKASWLQNGKTILNPYLGKAMAHCGIIKS